MDSVFSALGEHWAFFAAALIFSVVGQVMKGAVFTKERIARHYVSKPWLNKLLWWGRKTLPLHPVIAGVAIANVPGMPVPAMITSGAGAMLYFGLAGIFSTWAFDILQGVLKKQGIELSSVMDSRPPPAS